jgi:hypothetical protein
MRHDQKSLRAGKQGKALNGATMAEARRMIQVPDGGSGCSRCPQLTKPGDISIKTRGT